MGKKIRVLAVFLTVIIVVCSAVPAFAESFEETLRKAQRDTMTASTKGESQS